MAEAFAKTFKRDYVYIGDVSSAATVINLLPEWFADYNENHPHKGLKMLSPRQFRRSQSAEQKLSGLMGQRQGCGPHFLRLAKFIAMYHFFPSVGDW